MEFMFRSLQYKILALVFVAIFSFPLVATASDVSVEWEEAVAMQRYLVWLRVNEARMNPLEVLERLEIPLETAQAAFGEDAGSLVDGLPPLAWSTQLDQVASQHARDMIDHLFYSHVSSDGSTLSDRVAASGYQAVSEAESLGILLFLNPVELERGVTIMLDNMMRDELTGVSGASRNVFSTEFTEVGISFSAEVLPAITEQPFVYLVVADFAKPVTPQRILIGQYNVNEHELLYMRPTSSSLWSLISTPLPGLFQIPYPEGGASFVFVQDELKTISAPVELYDRDFVSNDYIDLRINE